MSLLPFKRLETTIESFETNAVEMEFRVGQIVKGETCGQTHLYNITELEYSEDRKRVKIKVAKHSVVAAVLLIEVVRDDTKPL